jgi:alkylation response protein AidB-like acyl-CoA dehydrogenase
MFGTEAQKRKYSRGSPAADFGIRALTERRGSDPAADHRHSSDEGDARILNGEPVNGTKPSCSRRDGARRPRW